jgi:UDPglucose 6-dehydrogenase
MNKRFDEITIVGAGYVGSSMASLFGQNLKVNLVDNDPDKIKKINENKSPIKDYLIQEYLDNKKTNFRPLTKINDEILFSTDLFILALPTNFDEETLYFDTSILDLVIENILSRKEDSLILIKSTIPVGYINKKRKEHNTNSLFFSPEFLREGNALNDNLYPARIVVGDKTENGKKIANLFKSFALNDPRIILMESTEAESVKLFSNTYLAMRIAFFNELDSYCISKDINAQSVIEGVSSDSRIGNHYNNPSFGYGGYCLPKDTKQLLTNYKNIPQNLIGAIIDSNKSRKNFIKDDILKNYNTKLVGVYRLIMKEGSDNIKESSIIDVMQGLIDNDIEMLIYEPLLKEKSFMGITITSDFELFSNTSTMVITNRKDNMLDAISSKLYSRDIYNEN